jgi:hypothetical protein
MLEASCHCGAIRLQIHRKPRSVTECNCSICGRLGARWAYYTDDGVHIDYKPGALQGFLYRTRTYEYFHCKICGCTTHYRRINTKHDDRIAVNARMINPADIESVKVRSVDVRKPGARASRPEGAAGATSGKRPEPRRRRSIRGD